jgi:hypothetical protein
VLNHVLALLDVALRLPQLSSRALSSKTWHDSRDTNLLLLFFLLHDFDDFVLQRVHIVGPFRDDLRGHEAMADVVLVGTGFDDRLEQLTIALADEGDRAVRWSE